MFMDQEGPQINGKWINKRNGNVIVVRDNIITEDGMQVILNNGAILDMDIFSRDYVQMSDEDYDMDGNVINTKMQSKPEIRLEPVTKKPSSPKQSVAPINTSFDPDAFMDIADPVDASINNAASAPIAIESAADQSIGKVMGKVESKPNIKISFDWDEFPTDALKMLKTFFDVTDEQISSYIYHKYFNVDEIIDTISKEISKRLS